MSFDKLAFVKHLEGPETFSRPQAEALDHAIHETVATKQDVRAVETTLRAEMATLRAELRGEMATLGAELRGEMATLRTDLVGQMALVRSELMGQVRANTLENRLWTLAVIASVLVSSAGVVLSLFRH